MLGGTDLRMIIHMLLAIFAILSISNAENLEKTLDRDG
jgi:hypothetical protein